MDPKDLDRLIQKYLEGNCSEEERRLIDSLYSSLGTNTTDTPVYPEKEQLKVAEERILRSLTDHTERSESQHKYFWRYASVAASLICLLATGYYFIRPERVADQMLLATHAADEYKEVENTSAMSKRTILPDGSMVNMSPGSRIRFSKEFEGAERELFLEGEAYFDVAHNNERPFYVYARNVVTKVLGTSFIVSARGNDEKVTVSVKTGKVSVYSRKAAHKKTVLTPNQEAVYDEVTEHLATKEVTAITSNDVAIPVTEMRFEETPVSEVLVLLTETYAIDINFDKEALSGCVLTSSFFDEGLYDRIDVICTAIGATYKIVDARIIIESNGCTLKTD